MRTGLILQRVPIILREKDRVIRSSGGFYEYQPAGGVGEELVAAGAPSSAIKVLLTKRRTEWDLVLSGAKSKVCSCVHVPHCIEVKCQLCVTGCAIHIIRYALLTPFLFKSTWL